MIPEEKIRSVALCIARTKVEFGYRGPIEMFRAQAINILEHSKTAGAIEDNWSRDYDTIFPGR